MVGDVVGGEAKVVVPLLLVHTVHDAVQVTQGKAAHHLTEVGLVPGVIEHDVAAVGAHHVAKLTHALSYLQHCLFGTVNQATPDHNTRQVAQSIKQHLTTTQGKWHGQSSNT